VGAATGVLTPEKDFFDKLSPSLYMGGFFLKQKCIAYTKTRAMIPEYFSAFHRIITIPTHISLFVVISFPYLRYIRVKKEELR